MDETTLNFLKIIFLFGFTLHNIEEAIWLPKWSKYAKRFHESVTADQFIFAVIVVTIIGYVLTALEFLFGLQNNLINLIYLGFVGMMGINTIFPHLLAAIKIRKYSPGLITAIFLNLPFSSIIIWGYIISGINALALILSILAVSAIILFSLKYLFKLGSRLINFDE